MNYDLAAGHISLGMALFANADKAKAISEFKRAIALNPLSGPAHLEMAMARAGKEAEQLYQKAVSLSPGNWIPYNELAVFYFSDARFDESIAVWRKGLSFAEDNVTLMVNLGAGLHKAGRFAESAEAIQSALALDDSKALIWANLGTAHYFQGRYLDAARASEKSVERSLNATHTGVTLAIATAGRKARNTCPPGLTGMRSRCSRKISS